MLGLYAAREHGGAGLTVVSVWWKACKYADLMHRGKHPVL